MCDSLKNINKVKAHLKKEEAHKLYLRQVKLINELGVDADNYIVLDRREMTSDLINQYELALNPNSDSIKSVIPSSERVRVRIGPSTGYELRYNYDLRSGIDGPKILPNGRTRDFCEHLIDANKLYTRQEIERMSNGFGTSVFRFAGGYYTNPETGETTPFCRHNFYENLVIRK